MTDKWLINFITESNRIEGIIRRPTKGEIAAHENFLALDPTSPVVMNAFVWDVARAELRIHPGMNVQVGSHIPPQGGPAIAQRLQDILHGAKTRHPYLVHRDYETLHPYIDGNGRSGRVLWLWMMINRGERWRTQAVNLGFLHTWYYQSLEHADGRDT